MLFFKFLLSEATENFLEFFLKFYFIDISLFLEDWIHTQTIQAKFLSVFVHSVYCCCGFFMMMMMNLKASISRLVGDSLFSVCCCCWAGIFCWMHGAIYICVSGWVWDELISFSLFYTFCIHSFWNPFLIFFKLVALIIRSDEKSDFRRILPVLSVLFGFVCVSLPALTQSWGGGESREVEEI